MEARTCDQCGHDFEPHQLVMVEKKPIPLGFILCQDPECACFSTWGVPMGDDSVEARIHAQDRAMEIITEYGWASALGPDVMLIKREVFGGDAGSDV